MKQHLKSYIELIVLFVHLKNKSHPWPQQITREKQILPKQNDLFAQLHHLYLIRVIGQSRNIILCYKDRKGAIVPGSSQFTPYIIGSISLSTGKAKMCSSLQVSWQRVNQPFYIISEVNRTIILRLFIVQTSDRICYLLPYFGYNSAIFYKTNFTHSIFRTIEARASIPQQIIKLTKTQNFLLIKRTEFFIRRGYSVRSIFHYVVCGGIMGFEQKLSKKSYFNSISKITRPTSHF